MKKIIFFLLLLSVLPRSTWAINGFGTFAQPYHGTITVDTVWNTSSNKIYINGDITVTAHLTINQGLTIVFVSTGADLIITGNGILSAIGGSGSNMIRFTADFNDNGIYGESGERWGHISFESMTPGFTTPSVINYCIIEFGQKNSSPSEIESYGGGIQAAFTYLTISSCIIRNNYAGWGGGIFVNANSSPAISNCQIYNNTGSNAGGGLYIWQNSNSQITNSIVSDNSAGTVGGGGFLLGDNCGNVRIINCTVVSNTSSDPLRGQNIQFHYTLPTRIQVINSIVWGSDNSIFYLGYSPNSGDFINCAIQDVSTPASTYTNCINLNSNNSATYGPNFYNVTPGSEDYHILFISPCRDIGSLTGAPLTDYDGNPRIGPYDIGTYEVQYSRWSTTPFDVLTWTDPFNWEQNYEPGHSGTTGDVVIPLLSSSSSAPNVGFVTIGSGKSMVLEPGAMASFGNLTNNGSLLLKSDASNISSLITDSYAGNDANIELYLTGGGTKTTYKWHYISSPITSLPVSTFSPAYTLDLAQYVESRPTSSLREGWVAYDGYVYSTGLMGGPTFSNLTPGKGYDYYKSTDNKYTFSGQLNTGDVTVSLGFSGDATLNGFNLLGNPFSSGLNWDDLVGSIYFPFPPNTSQALYFTRDNVQCTYVSGVGIPSGVTGIIPPMQGFFSKTYSSGNSITFPATSRVHDLIHPRYKGYNIVPLIRLTLTDDTLTDETVIRFNDQAKAGLDNNYDAIKFSLSTDITSIYTVSQGTKFAINGQPFPQTTVDIPVVLNLTTDSARRLNVTQLQGLDNYDVQLIDNVTGIVTNLKTDPSIPFTAQKGTISNRFIVRVNNIITGIENPVSSDQVFNIYPANGLLNILTLSDLWDGKMGSVKVLDITGKTILFSTNQEFNKNLLIQVQAPDQKGIYMVELRSGALRYVGKVVIR